MLVWVKCTSGKAKKGAGGRPQLKSPACCASTKWWFVATIGVSKNPRGISFACSCTDGAPENAGYWYDNSIVTTPSDSLDRFVGAFLFSSVSPCSSIGVSAIPFHLHDTTGWEVLRDVGFAYKIWVRCESRSTDFRHGIDTPFWDFGPEPFPPVAGMTCSAITFPAIL